MDPRSEPGVSFVVPVYDGERHLAEVLDAILAQADGRPFETIVVDDGSCDGSAAILRRYAADGCIRLLTGAGRGAAAAINLGLQAASHPIVCQVDQDVVLRAGWMRALVAALAVPGVAAAQGYYETPRDGSLWARAMGLDLELRYSRLRGAGLGHACTGNVAWRAEALRAVGGLDESLGYGYDNDLSYRLVAAGWRLAFCREARSVHRWRGGVRGYLRQQYGVGYGRLDLVAKHRDRRGGDDVSGMRMIAHVPAMAAALLAALAAGAMALAGGDARPAALFAALLLAALTLDRAVAGAEAAWRFRDPAGLWFVPAHLVRDLGWVVALAVWSVRRFGGRAPKAWHSMGRGSLLLAAAASSPAAPAPPDARDDFLVLVPARNEAANLPAVLGELRGRWPGREVVVVDDASRDDTARVVVRLGVRCLRLCQHLGVGGAMRAGLRDALRRGYGIVVRVDGDGQHPPDEIAALLEPIFAGRADAVQGTRAGGVVAGRRGGLPLLAQRLLARLLTPFAGRHITDATSGFWAFGPAAVRLLAEHHPTGYPEPELLLLLRRNLLRVDSVPVAMRERKSGRTSLTLARTVLACLRVLLAVVVVPQRAPIRMARNLDTTAGGGR
jgi:glycosyltransferase involved in cell wall biosynthesis